MAAAGAAADAAPAPAAGDAQPPLPAEVDVAIIGAGIAGLACASRLRSLDAALRVLVLEADTRIGGRAATVEVGGYRVDAGAGWIHGASGNPLLEDGVLEHDDIVPCTSGNIWTAGPLPGDSSNFHPTAEEAARWRSRLQALSAAVEARSDISSIGIEEELGRCAPLGASDERLLRAFELWLGAPAAELLPGEWDPEARLGDFPGPHAVVRKGMPLVADRLLARSGGVGAVALGAEVRATGKAKGGGFELTVAVGGHVSLLRCRFLVCTASLGLLQRADSSPLRPPAAQPVPPPLLPQALKEAIGRLRMSPYRKCILVLERRAVERLPVWIWTDHTGFPMAFNYWPVLEKPVVALTSVRRRQAAGGGAAGGDDVDEGLLAEALAALRVARSQVLDFYITRWDSAPWALGSYSFSPAGSDCCETDAFRAAEEECGVVFAGEHTHEEHQGSVHGAYLSGKEAAERVVARHTLLLSQ